MKILRRRKGEAQDRFQHLLAEGNVPTFPGVVADAIMQVSSPDFDLGQVARTIAADPKLTIAVLKLANSPAFAPRSPITSVHQAVVLLGRNQLESQLIACGVARALPPEPTTGYTPSAFWAVAAQRAATAAAMAARVDPASQYEQFTAALLQDMAQPILLHSDTRYVQLLIDSGDSHRELASREQGELGWTHPEIGELLCTEWGLPRTLCDSVSVHHEDAVAGHEVTQWVSLIEGDRTDTDQLIEAAERLLRVGEDVVAEVLSEAAGGSSEVASAFA